MILSACKKFVNKNAIKHEKTGCWMAILAQNSGNFNFFSKIAGDFFEILTPLIGDLKKNLLVTLFWRKCIQKQGQINVNSFYYTDLLSLNETAFTNNGYIKVNNSGVILISSVLYTSSTKRWKLRTQILLCRKHEICLISEIREEM